MNRSLAVHKTSIVKNAIHAGMASSLVLACATVGALGLGELKTDAQIGQALKGKIDIIGEGADFDVDLVQVRRIQGAEAEQFGYELVGPYFPLTFNVQQDKGDAFIELQSQKPIKEPFLEFLVELYWPTGNVIRQYLVLPTEPPSSSLSAKPNYQWQGQAAATPTTVNGTPPPQPAVKRSDGPVINVGDLTYTVQSGDLLSTIARNWGRTTGQSSKQLTRAATKWLIDNNSSAFPNGNPNDLRVGVVLKLPPSVQLSPLAGEANGTAEVFRAVGSDAPAQQSGRVVLHAEPISLTDQMNEIDTLRAQMDVAQDEIMRLRRENDSFRRRLLTLENGGLENTLSELNGLQLQKIEKLKQQQEQEARPRAIAPTRRSEEPELQQKPVPADTTTDRDPVVDNTAQDNTPQDSAGQTNITAEPSILDGLGGSNLPLIGGAGALAGLLALLFFRRRAATAPAPQEPELGLAAPPAAPAVAVKATKAKPLDPKDSLLPTVSDTLSEPEEDYLRKLKQHSADDLPADIIDLELPEQEPQQEPEQAATPSEQPEEVSLQPEVIEPVVAPAVEQEIEASVPESNPENDWMDRKFGSAADEEVADGGQIMVEGEVAPYSEDKLNLMPWADEDEMPQFELDEELLENLAEDISVEELEADIAANEDDIDQLPELPQGDVEEFRSLDISASIGDSGLGGNGVEDDGEEEGSDQGLISEIEMYLQLGQQDKASRLLGQLLDDVSIDQNDPRIQSLIERCRPKQA